jgi:hypothetical protein
MICQKQTKRIFKNNGHETWKSSLKNLATKSAKNVPCIKDGFENRRQKHEFKRNKQKRLRLFFQENVFRSKRKFL